MASQEDVLKRIKESIGAFPDFPIKGIIFRDIFPLMRKPEVFRECIDLMTNRIKTQYPDVSVIVGLDARGFIFAPLIAQNLNISFVPVRKKGKLPGETASTSYSLEYGKDAVEVQKDAIKPGEKVVIVDDLIATGGTMKAAYNLMKELKADIVECMVVIELVDLKGREQIPANFYSLVEFGGH